MPRDYFDFRVITTGPNDSVLLEQFLVPLRGKVRRGHVGRGLVAMRRAA